LHKNQRAFKKLASEIDSDKTPEEVLLQLGGNHPDPSQLLDTFRGTFDSLVAFIRSKSIVTIPSDVPPTLEETPPFMRATTQASMDTPGPYERNSTKAYFNVTLPDPSWPPERTASFMRAFNVGTITSTAIHEAYPGHYIQFLGMPAVKTKVRKLLGCSSNAEGWAHYCEQMMLDEGYAAGDRWVRLGQLQDALMRNARFIVGIQMHCRGMTLEDAQRFFVDEGFQSEEIAQLEVKRGTADPTYLYYTLGKLEILKLREDARKAWGAAWSLQRFHDSFLQQGFPPIRLVREALLSGPSAAGLSAKYSRDVCATHTSATCPRTHYPVDYQVDAAGAQIQIEAISVKSAADGGLYYRPNDLADAQLFVAKHGSGIDELGKSTIADRTVSWAEDRQQFTTPFSADHVLMGGGDFMAHVAKPSYGLRLEGIDGLLLEDVSVEDVEQIGRYPSADLTRLGCPAVLHVDGTQVGALGPDAVGIGLASNKNIRVRRVRVKNVRSRYGNSRDWEYAFENEFIEGGDKSSRAS
jgi:hypothetical protein